MKSILALIAALSVVVTACGSGSDVADTTVPTPTTTLQATTTTTSTTTTTVAPTTTTSEASSEPASAADAEAITSTYEIVFSSETTFEEKAPLLDDPTGLEDTVLKYIETGDSMGGVGLAAKKITVDGSVATVIYDLLFGGSPTYPDLTGDAVLIDGTWKVTREMFCSIMTSARVGCPAP